MSPDTINAMVPFLLFCQAFGAIIGAFTAVWSEMSYLYAMRDGNIDTAERAHLQIITHGLRFGMVLLLLASLGLVIVNYSIETYLQPALSTWYWIFIMLALLIMYVSWSLSRKRISFALGSAIVFTSWWFLVYLTIGEIPPLSFGAAVAFLVVATTIFYALLQYGRFLMLGKISRRKVV